MKEITEIKEIFNKGRESYGEIAKKSGISRTTLLSVRNQPLGAKLSTLMAVAKAMGYTLKITLEKSNDNTNSG